MELLRLRYFYTVAREGGFLKASRVLRVQQPAISKMVRQLEDRLQATLLERHNKGVYLTPVGAEVYKKCQVLFDQVDAIYSLAAAQQTDYHGPLALGATDSVASYVIPQALGDFLREHPKVAPSLFSGTSNLVSTEILEGRVEFGFFFTLPAGDFRVTDLVQVPFQLVAPPGLSPAEALRKGFVISREIDYPKARPFPVLEMLKKNGIEVRPVVSSNNLDAQKQLVMQGLGVALLPSFMVSQEIQDGQLRALLPKKSFSYSLKLVTRKQKALSRNALRFIQFVERVLQSATNADSTRR